MYMRVKDLVALLLTFNQELPITTPDERNCAWSVVQVSLRDDDAQYVDAGWIRDLNGPHVCITCVADESRVDLNDDVVDFLSRT